MTDEWRRSVEKRLQNIELRSAVDEVQRGSIETRLRGIEDTLKWLVRLIIGALILALIGYGLKGGLQVL